MSVAVDRDQAFLDGDAPDRRRGRGAARRRRRPRGALPAETIDALREAARAVGVRARRARRRRRLVRGDRRAPASSSAAAAAPARWSSRCTRSRSRRSCATSTTRRGSRTTCATLAGEQRLIASVTSEVGTGGDMGRSIAAVTAGRATARCTLREAGADGQLRRPRRRPPHDAAPRARRRARRPGPRADAAATRSTLEQTGTWDPLGMRGTCSPGFVVRAEFAPEQVLADAVPDGVRRVDGAGLAHPLVAPLARHRHRRLRPRARLRARGGQAQARRAAAGGACASRT